jgi:hypothetical protein
VWVEISMNRIAYLIYGVITMIEKFDTMEVPSLGEQDAGSIYSQETLIGILVKDRHLETAALLVEFKQQKAAIFSEINSLLSSASRNLKISS